MKKSQVANQKVVRQNPWIVVFTFTLSFILVTGGSCYGAYYFFKLNSQSITNFSSKTIAHRGCMNCDGVSENSFKSLDHVIKKQLDGMEIDVQVTSDDQVVVIHDSSISRVAKQVLKSKDIIAHQISEIKFSQLKQYILLHDNTTIPALSEFLAKMQAGSTTIRLVIEVKEYLKTDVVIKTLVEQFKNYGFHDRVVVSSYNPILLYSLKKADPRISTMLLTRRYLMTEWFSKHSHSKPTTIQTMNEKLVKVVEYLSPYTDWLLYKSSLTWVPSLIGVDHICFPKSIDLNTVKDFQKRGYQVCVFLGDDVQKVDQLKELGVWTIKNS